VRVGEGARESTALARVGSRARQPQGNHAVCRLRLQRRGRAKVNEPGSRGSAILTVPLSTRRWHLRNGSSTLGFWFLLVACADLKAPPTLGSGGEPSPSAAGNTSPSNGGAVVATTGGSDNGGGAGVGGGAGAGVGHSAGSSGAAAGSAGSEATGGSASPEPVAGAAGAAGEQGADDACRSKTSGDIRAWFHPEIAAAVSNEIHPFVALTNAGTDIPLKQLTIRYYFTGEMSGDWQAECIWVPKQGGGGLCDSGVGLKIVSLDPPRPQADHYLEVSFADVSSDTLSSVPSPVFEARSRFWRLGLPMMNQANDYSFVSTTSEVMVVEGRTYSATSKITVYRDGALVWGEEPCP
jgi:Cellulose binding domain